jgi:aspartate carbamoyltransferase catalytic subunit
VKHLLDIESFSHDEVMRLIQRALYFKQAAAYPNFSSTILGQLFYENSTRTRISFELAAKHLGMQSIDLDIQTSSEQKGETIEDTVDTLAAMGIQLFVIRHAENGLPAKLAANCSPSVQIINAGDGTHAHPSQALLDLMTVMEKKPDLHALKFVIIGDVRHSRVANSLQALCALLKVGQLVFVAPKMWQPQSLHYGLATESLAQGLKDADVVMCLRVQRERLLSNEVFNLAQYQNDFSLSEEMFRQAKPDAILMHPGPINRGVEMEASLVSAPQSLILEQVKNGVFMRMAILESLITPS